MKAKFLIALLLIAALALVACQPTAPAAEQPAAEEPAAEEPAEEAAETEFLSMGDMERQLAQMEMEPEGPADKPWEQMLPPIDMVDTSGFTTDAPWTICFSNASLTNTWRVTGFKVMNYEVSLHPEIGEFRVTDAGGDDAKQIADVEDLIAQGDCDAFIIAPNTTEALTPVVEQLYATGKPVVVFDRGVNTTDYTTFIHPIGGFAFGYVGADWLAREMGGEGKVLALRVLPGVDVLETRWQAAEAVFSEYPGIEVVGVEFNESDPAKAKAIVTDYLERYGSLDGVWSDFGGVSTAVYEAFVDYGAEVPPITAEDQNVWLLTWQREGLSSIAPTYPTFQWRTAVIAAVRVLQGQEVPKEWVLPQPPITNENLDQYAAPDLPDDAFVMCGCLDVPNFWGE